ncbi:hypothetical protein U4960_07695 [Altererythrobacter sp. H2]|uniref:hypothetical protein n=1 Tax=Altererythrobacter sp. H2 TaxID=3108391 RepID=UPI000BD53171|nr:hypothetical protein [Altererythrobacter sp. H2]OZA94640.1 MAG: hypothetical protein B7X57_00755 [Erythrobacter sp. 34-65-8]WRK97188.1 hypothetical protein U4960_07695 [Altererythrobacter sp. H2]
MKLIARNRKMPGLRAPAFFFAALACAATAPAFAQVQQVQGQPTVQPPASMRPTPSQLELSKLIWSTFAAVDHANRSGNYSVLRDISSQGFQIANTASRLSEIFAGLRNSQIDLSNAFLVPPTYLEAPRLVREDLFQVKGLFQLRPISLAFDFTYQWEQGRWKLYAINITPAEMVQQAPAAR